MKKYLLLALAGAIQIISVHAQNVIQGRVSDSEDGAPLFGATVYIAELKTGASTDAAGYFIIRNVPLGTFLGEVRMLGYASQVVSLPSEAQGKQDPTITNVTLIKTPAEYDPVIITGVSGATDRLRNPVPTTLQTRDHMLQHASSNAIGALTELPGISAVSTGNAIAKPVIRGLGYNRVVVLRNGVRQEGQQWGDEHGIEIDEYEIDRVEIIKGPGSIMYGSDAMAGVINFLTPRPVEEGRIRGEFITSFQTNGALAGNSLLQEGNMKGFSWQVRGTMKDGGNYFTPADGYVPNTGFRERNLSGFIGLNRSWGVSQICFSTFNQTLGLPEGERDSLGNFIVPIAVDDSTIEEISYHNDDLFAYQYSRDVPRQEIHHHRMVLSNNLFFGQSRLKVDMGYQVNNRNEFGNVLEPDEKEVSMQLHTATLNASFTFPERKNNQWIAGICLQRQQNYNTGEELIIPEYIAQDGGAYAHYRRISGKWYFGAGLRGDFRVLQTDAVYIDSSGSYSDVMTDSAEVKFTAIDKTFSSFSAIAGASYQPAERAVFRVNLSRGFRVPNIAEISSNGRHEGTFRYETGNTELKPETSIQLDLGLTVTTDHFNLEVSAFCNDINNFIYLSKLNSVFGGDSIADPSDPAPVFSFTQGHARLYGGEIFTDLHPHPLDWLHFENSVSFVYGELLNHPDSTRYLPFIPPVKYQSEVNAHLEKQAGIFANAYCSVALGVYFAQNRFFSAYGTETATPGYALLEAGAGTDIVNKKGTTVCRIFFSAGNLLNTNYQSHLSRLKYAPENPATGKQGIYAPGRNFSLRVVVPFTFRST